jgi:tryptophan 2,3-dioxygenase
MSDPTSALNYSNYLAIDELLDLQRPVSDGPEHDEMLFIVIHQVYELWFKQLLHEIDDVKRSLEAGDGFAAGARLNRIKAILAVCIRQIDVLITMTPLQFGAFRHRLETASGFQSAQFRELEAVLGRRDPSFAQHLLPDDQARVERRMSERSLWDSMLVYINSLGFDIPSEVLQRNLAEPYVANAQVHEALLALHRQNHEAIHLCEQLIDIEVSLKEWRYRHVMMVERTIGTKQGTGGSSGAGYLQSTLGHPRSFPELWEIRASF